MKKIILLLLVLCGVFSSERVFSQCSTTVIPNNNSTSGNFRGLMPNFGRGVTVFYISQAEMAVAGFSSGAILQGIGGTFSTAPNAIATGNLSIWMENTADATNLKSTTWLTAISTMTQVRNSSFTIPAALNWDATFTSNFTYTGNGVYVAIEWTNCITPLPTGTIVACNNSLVGGANGCKSAQLAACTAITTTASSAFRPVTRFLSSSASNLVLNNIWPHGKIPAGAGAPESIPFTVTSSFGSVQNTTASLTIKESVSGTIRYTATMPIAVGACGSSNFAFQGWNPSIQETDSVLISVTPVAGESNLTDNELGRTEIVGSASYTHTQNAFGGTFSGVGFNTGSGIIVAKHTASGCISVSGVKVRLDPSAVGNTVYGVLVNNTGAVIAQSPNYVVLAGDANTVLTFTFPAPVSVSNQDFYVGLAQTANVVTGYFPVSCQVENPTKPDVYYAMAITGGAFGLPYTTLNRWYIEADITATPNVYASVQNVQNSYCAGTNLTVAYTVLNGTINAGNIYALQLSDATGSFTSPTLIGTLSSTNTIGTITGTIPLSTPGSGLYRVRVNSSNSGIIGCANSTLINIFGAPTFTAITPTDATCNGASNGSIAASSAAVLPVFSLNPVGAQSPPGTFVGLGANTYTVTVTDGNNCSRTSTTVVGQPSALNPSIAATTLCAGGNATLTASTTGGTPTYTYQWISGYNTATVTLNPSKDNTIFQDLIGNSNGAGSFMAAGNDGSNSPRRALMAFDLTTLPPGATINSATLNLNCSQTSAGAGAQAQYLHRLNQNWGEGLSSGPGGTGAAATVGDATWPDAFNPSTPWATSGGNFAAVASATTTVNAVGPYVWTSATMLSDVINWYMNPVTNFGWLLKGDETGPGQAKRYDSKENATIANRPTLVVNYTAPIIAGTGTTLSINTAGTYTVLVTDANGCTSTTSIIITSSPLPNVTATATPATICLGASTVLSGTNAVTYNWNPGNLTGNPSVTPGATTTYTVSGTDGNGCSNTSTVEVTVNTAPTPNVTNDSVCAPGGTVNLAATGTIVTWYDQLTGGSLLNTGNSYNPSIAGTTTYYVENSTTVSSAPVNAPMPGQTGTFTGNVRGYWFTAPTNFTITSIQVPTTASSAAQSIAVVKFTGNTPPPVFSTTTNAFTTVFLTQSNATPGNIAVNIPVVAGEVIGILGVRSNITSYSNVGNTTTIAGFSVPLTRLGMQFNLVTTAPQSLWQEPSSLNIGRVNFEYTTTVPGCTSTPRVPVTGVVNPLPAVTATPATQAICQNGQTSVAGGGALSYTWTGGINDNTPFTVTGSNTYTVTGTDANGCTNTATAVVNMNASPAVIATPATQAICQNGQTSVAGGGAVSYVWTGGISDNTPFTVTASNTYTVTGTDANGCTNSATAVVNMNLLPSVTATPTTQTICENAQATVAGGGAVSYVWTGGIIDNSPFTVTSPNTYTVTGTDGNGCTNTATAQVSMNAAPLVTGGLTPASGCVNSIAVANSSGTALTYSWSGGITDGQPFLIGSGATIYTVTGVDGNACSASSTVLMNGSAASGSLAPATSNAIQNHGDDLNASYYDASCNLIASIDDGAGGNILGNTAATVNVDATTGFHNGQPFVRRWYQIIPSSNGAADVQLYLMQADFDNYNSVVTLPYLPLPTGPADVTGMANVRITKNTDAGLGNSPMEITPLVTWNGSYWVLSFTTPSFSQFRVHSANPGGIPLPVALTKFDGRKLNSSNMLEWSTASEMNNSHFNLQYSTNGSDFATIAKVDSKAPNGLSSTTINYSFEHLTPALGHNYYRLQQVDLDNQSTLNAKVVDLIWGTNGSTVSIYPNPTQDVLNIDLYTSKVQNTTVKVLDMSGRIVKQIQARSEAGMNKLSISLGEVAGGIYTVQVFENDQLTHVDRVNKK